MTITKYVAAAVTTVALLSTPAFAQSSATKAEDYAKEKAVKEMKDEASDMAPDEMKSAVEMQDAVKSEGTPMMIKGDPLTIETPTAKITAEDAEMTMEEGKTSLEADEIKTESKMMETPAATTVLIACPEGTTAQADGTCMITGDYKG